MRSTLLSGLILLSASTIAQAAGLTVLDAEIDAAPDQHITVTATGTDTIAGLNLYVQVHGAALVITDISIVGSIWEGNNEGPTVLIYPDSGIPDEQFAALYLNTHDGTVTTPGILAVLIVNATGLAGSQAVITADTDLIASDFVGEPVNTFVDGTITIRDSSPPPANLPPIIDAGLAQTVTAGQQVTLHGYATDPESASMTYGWTQLSGPTIALEDDDTLTPSFTAPDIDMQTAIMLRLTVSDGENQPTDLVTITVNPAANQAPLVDAGSPQTVASGASMTLHGTASDPDLDPLQYTWTIDSGPVVILSGANTLTATFTAPTVTAARNIVFRLTADDGQLQTSDTVTITISPPPVQPPDDDDNTPTDPGDNTGPTTPDPDDQTPTDNGNPGQGDTNNSPDTNAGTTAAPGCGAGLMEMSLLSLAALAVSLVGGRRSHANSHKPRT